MKAVEWNPEDIIRRSDGVKATAADMVQVVRQGERVVVQVQESEVQRVLGPEQHQKISMALFRQGCVKSVEAPIDPLPQRSRILAEIHRRLDCVERLDHRSAGWRLRLVSVFEFAGAWALAAHLMREGLNVAVIERNRCVGHGECHGARADVEIVLPIGPATQYA